MENYRSVFIIVILTALLFSSCSKKGKPVYTSGDQSKLIFYTNPSTDCIDCIFKAIKVLDRTPGVDQDISVLIKKGGEPKVIENFKSMIKEKFPQRDRPC